MRGKRRSGRIGDVFAIWVQHVRSVKVGIGGGPYLVWVTQVLTNGGRKTSTTVSELSTLGGVQGGSVGPRRYLTLARNAVPGYCLCKPNFRLPTPTQVSETWSVGQISEGSQLWLLSGEYKCNVPVSWFCTGCGGMD